MVLYRTEDDSATVSALIKDETIWITQKAMAELFGIDKSGISRHLAIIFETSEWKERIHSICSSERRIWQQITDIFAECSIDYKKYLSGRAVRSVFFL